MRRIDDERRGRHAGTRGLRGESSVILEDTTNGSLRGSVDITSNERVEKRSWLEEILGHVDDRTDVGEVHVSV